MLVGYARVSTDLQTTDGQIDALHAAGCERVFQESMSGPPCRSPTACRRFGVRPRG
jgi:DNA invertase Pin-like site-specific DNA recombinase